MPAPAVVVLGGPNGAGKSTAAPRLLRGSLKVEAFVNADTLAQGLSGFRPEDVALEAGRIMLNRLNALESQRKSFAFEATLASRALARRREGRNFFALYQPLADTWRLYDGSSIRGPRLVASGGVGKPTRIRDQATWQLASGDDLHE